MNESSKVTGQLSLDEETMQEVRGCLAICLYNIIWAPADDYAAEITAEQLIEHRTIIEDPAKVPAFLELALKAPPGLLESFNLLHDRAAIVSYLERLREHLLQLLSKRS